MSARSLAPRLGVLLLVAVLAMIPIASSARVETAGLLDSLVTAFTTHAKTWAAAIDAAALYLFGTIAAISLVWRMGFLVLHRAEPGEFFVELIKFTINTGFFLWLLTNGTTIAGAIFKSMQVLGADAGGAPPAPSALLDLGAAYLNTTIDAVTGWEAAGAYVSAFFTGGMGGAVALALLQLAMAAATLCALAMITAEYIVLVIEAYTLGFAGSLLLGFGGSHWTREIAVNYFKTCLALGMQMLTLALIIQVTT
jgi:P-type conjugative transfer protein TrbL